MQTETAVSGRKTGTVRKGVIIQGRQLTPTETRVLHTLVDYNQPVTVPDLSASSNLSTGSLYGPLQRLENRGLVFCERTTAPVAFGEAPKALWRPSAAAKAFFAGVTLQQSAPVFPKPEGYSDPVHREQKENRTYFGLSNKPGDIGVGLPALVFVLSYPSGDRSLRAHLFKPGMEIIRAMAERLNDVNPIRDFNQCTIRTHGSSVSVVAPVLGEGLLNEAWARGLQTSFMLRGLLDPTRRGNRITIDHMVIPGIAADGYLTAYPKKPYMTSAEPNSGAAEQYQAPSYVRETFAELCTKPERHAVIHAIKQQYGTKAKPN